MNNIDIIVLIILIFSTFVGFVRGGLASILSTIGWLVTIIGTHYLFGSIEPFLEAKFNSKILTFIVGYVGSITALLFLTSIVNFVIFSVFNQFKGGTIDKILGIIFGAARGILIIAVVFLCFESGMKALSGEANSIKEYPDIVLDATTLPFIKKAELILIAYVPDNFKESIHFNKLISNDEKISDMVLLNLVRKLSEKIPPKDLAAINKAVEVNAQYMSSKQVLISKINAMWKYYQKNKTQKTSLSREDLKQISIIIN